jgi:hypothetical protein
MPIRNTTHILKNSDIVNRPLPSSLLKGEAIVNTADGIVYFSGVTTSTSEWTPAGTGSTANFFEVGSNLYDLRLRNRLTEYEGISGAGLIGKFLSGTTNGFVLADISSISGVDSYVTGGTYNPTTDAITLTLNEGKPNVVITGIEDNFTTGSTLIGSVAYFDRTDSLSAYTLDLSTFVSTGDTYVTGFTYDGANNLTITQTDDGPTLSVNINTMTGLTVNGTLSATTLDGNDILSGGTNLSTIFSTTDYYTTGFTYNPSTNTFQIGVNDGNSYPATINSVSGLTVSNLTAGRVVYVGTSGLLTDEAGFTYDSSTNTFSVPSDGTVNVGTGGLNVEGDAIIQGSLTVFGPSISAFTSELYVEDPNIILNYNPTGNSITTSVGAGWTIQDGNGIVSGDVNLDIIRLQNLTGLTATQVPNVSEYSGGTTGYINRGWITQLNDIVIRSTDVSDGGSLGDINGVRVLGEFDTLDGGNY